MPLTHILYSMNQRKSLIARAQLQVARGVWQACPGSCTASAVCCLVNSRPTEAALTSGQQTPAPLSLCSCWLASTVKPRLKEGLGCQEDLEMPLLGHRQALLRAIAQLPMLTEGSHAGGSASPTRGPASPTARAAASPASPPRCSIKSSALHMLSIERAVEGAKEAGRTSTSPCVMLPQCACSCSSQQPHGAAAALLRGSAQISLQQGSYCLLGTLIPLLSKSSFLADKAMQAREHSFQVQLPDSTQLPGRHCTPAP